MHDTYRKLIGNAAGPDGVVPWSTMVLGHEAFDAGFGMQVAYRGISIFLDTKEAPELWWLEGEIFDVSFRGEDDLIGFDIEGVRFSTTKAGDRIWVDYDTAAWIAQHEDGWRDATLNRIWLTRHGEALDPAAYQQLVAYVEETGGSFRWEGCWSPDLISEVLAKWSKTFCGLDIRFTYIDESTHMPAFYREALEEYKAYQSRGGEDGDDGVIAGGAYLCQHAIVNPGAMYGEIGSTCMNLGGNWRNPDGSYVCDLHKTTGAVKV